MSAARLSFTELLTDLELRVGLNGDASLGAVTSTAVNRAALARFLSNAAKTCHEMCVGKDWMWPWLVQTSASVTATSGVIDPAGLGDCRWFSLFSKDPRGTANPSAYWIPATVDGAGIWPVDPSQIGTYFAFYIPRTPEYTTTPIGTTTSFNADQLAWNDTGDGECYRALVDSVTAADLTDPTKWAVQPVYRNFQSAVAQMAHALWLRRLGKYPEAKEMDQEGYEDLSQQFQAVARDQANFHPARLYATGTWR